MIRKKKSTRDGKVVLLSLSSVTQMRITEGAEIKMLDISRLKIKVMEERKKKRKDDGNYIRLP